jgi:DNA polymerase-3 subunit beta
MKCRRDLWTKALDLAKHAVDSKSTMPILAQVVVEAKGGRAVISGTDLTRQMRLQLPCDGDLGVQSFDLRTLVQISKAAKKTKGEEIEIIQTKRGLQLKIAGRTFEVDQEGAGKDRPKDREGTGETVIRSWGGKEFHRALDYILPAMSRDETRFHLHGLALTDGVMVATDGHRMHKVDNVESFGEHEVIVDAGTAIALKDAIKQTEADYVRARYFDGSEGLVEWSIEGPRLDALIVAKPIKAQFPPYKQVIPKAPNSYSVDSSALRESITTAHKMLKASGADSNTKGVEMHANGDLRVKTDGFNEVLELASGADPEFHGGLNPAYMIDALRGANGICTIDYGEKLDGISVRTGEDFMAVVMPMRI